MAELPLPAGLNASTFPAKLWRLANSPRVRSVRWDSQGQGLLIDRALFEQELLSPAGPHGAGREGAAMSPDAFKATRFRSFLCQLSRYGFHEAAGRVGAAVPGDAGACLHYRNPWFRRDRPHLLLCIRRCTRAKRQRPAAGREERRRPRSRFQEPRRAAPSRQNLAAASPEGSELPPGPSRRSAGAQESGASPAPPKKVSATSRLPGASSEEPSIALIRKFHLRKLTVPLVRVDLKRRPELMVRLVCIDHQATSRALRESSSCTSSEQHTPARSPSAPSRQNLAAASPAVSELPPGPSSTSAGAQEPTPGHPAPSAPAGCAGWAAWTASSWAWNSPGEEELPPLDLDLVLETLEEMLSSSHPERSPLAQDNSGGEAVRKAAAEGALTGTESCRNSSLEPEEPDIHLIYLSRRAALRGEKRPRESL
ncbi:SH3 and multiple ankyrin repeat domains protein 1-like [Aphelocoma coerulescens]|uniref:SH3 and multiple ankyrin repeat domains protein 1-like n=1 Tax=Aphelocoma coerulescens TaxID=39617 RepID=UPI003604AF82